jgi:hypothetical protein
VASRVYPRRPVSTGRALILYAFGEPLRRATNRDHLYAFARHSSLRCHYVNIAMRPIPRRLRRLDYDLVVLHTSVLAGLRWPPAPPRWLRRRLEPIRAMGGVRIALPQDDFLRSRPVGEMLADLEVDHVFTPVPASEWDRVYAPLDRSRTQLHLALTGYLEDEEVARMERVTAAVAERRPIDVGYRAWHAPPWLGRHGALKTAIADAFATRGPEHGLVVDISTRDEDTKYGDDWTRFMAESKYTIGVEGGASIDDFDGSVRAATDAYLAAHPGASFEEVEAACFPGRDGELDLRALSPRHLEACVTRTCQVLIEGEYNGALEADVHYLPLRADFSNLDDVLEQMRRDERRAELVANAYRDVVASGRWTYASFVAGIERTALGADTGAAAAPPRSFDDRLSALGDRLSWRLVELRVRVLIPVWLRALRLIPRPVAAALKARMAR